MTARGCPIESLAKDKELQGLIDAFWRCRSLLRYEIYRPLALEELKKHGLAEPSLLLKLEEILENHLKQQRSKETEGENLRGRKWESSGEMAAMTSKSKSS